MEVKKTSKASLENKRFLFLEIGFVRKFDTLKSQKS